MNHTQRHHMGSEALLPFISHDTDDRAVREHAYRRAVLAEFAPGGRIAELGDDSDVGVADVVFGGREFGLGSEADRRRLLGHARRRLEPSGVLVLAVANGLFEARRFEYDGVVEVAGEAVRIQSQYDPVAGRVHGSVTRLADGECVFDIRVYTPSELAGMVRAAGFSLVRIDADFVPGSAVGVATRDVQIIARPLPSPPESLAVATWRTPDEPGFELRYAPDEVDWIGSARDEIWDAILRSEPRGGVGAAEVYPVDDPYGAERGAAAISTYFDCDVLTEQVTFGPGVTSLLASLANLADGGTILAPYPTHPDLEAWALARGATAVTPVVPFSAERLAVEILTCRPALVHMDRPSFSGELLSLADVGKVCETAARVGAFVLLDESPASYLGPSQSAVSLTKQIGNLVVLRGMTKAFSFGGLRVGFAVAGRKVAARIRELVPPLQVGEWSFRAALHILAAGDIFGSLRERIREIKPRFITELERAGFDVSPGHSELPWVLIGDNDSRVSRRLATVGIRGLRFVPPPTAEPRVRHLQLFVPLSDERLTTFHSIVANLSRSDSPSR